MTKTTSSWALFIVLVSVAGGVAVAAPEAGEEQTLMERFNAESNRIMMQYKNAVWRLEMDFKGMDVKQEAAAQKPTPFLACCRANIEKIESSISKLEGILVELAGCYEQSGNGGEKADISIVKADLAKFAKIIKEMSEITSRDDAKTKGSSGTKAFVDFIESAEALDGCPKP
jgi:hypothetical protein